jgi:hypothetical protein
MVERHRRGQRRPGRPGEPVAQFDRGHRVEAEFGEGPFDVDRVRRGITEYRGDFGADHRREQVPPLGVGEGGETLPQFGAGRGTVLGGVVP